MLFPFVQYADEAEKVAQAKRMQHPCVRNHVAQALTREACHVILAHQQKPSERSFAHGRGA